MSRRVMARSIRRRVAMRGHVGERRSGLLLAGLALALAATVLAACPVAEAGAPRLIVYGTFRAEGPGVAVDPSSGDVYTAGFFNLANTSLGSIGKFDASGAPLSPPFGLGLYAGVAVSPTTGDIDVANIGSSEIETYEPAGALKSSFPVASFGETGGSREALFNAVVQIATTTSGDIYVPNAPGKEVLEYSPGGVPIQSFTGGVHSLSGPTGVAVDAAGDVWIADGHKRIEELTPSGGFVGEFNSEGVQSLALGAKGEVYAIVENSADFCGSLAPPCAHLVKYSSSGEQVADIGAGSFGGGSGYPVPNMVAVNEASGRVYVTDGSHEVVWIFGQPSAPAVDRELSVEVGASEARLGALISGGGIETTYRFEYDTREYREGEGSHGVSVPFPEGSVGQSLAPRTVWAAASGLMPETTYHYRVVATNALGTVAGPDRTFTTGAQAACPNEQMRGGFSANLPECRAYELVTPANEASAEPEGGEVAARTGDRISYTANEVLPGSQSAGDTYVASRGVSGWSTEDVIPLQSYTAQCTEAAAGTIAQSTDLSQSVLFVGRRGNASTGENGIDGCDAEGVEVVPGEPIGYDNLLLRDNITGAFRLINVTPPGVAPADAQFRGASSDLRHVIFSEPARLTANALAGVENLYEWYEGALHLVTVLPNEVAVAGSLAGEKQPAHAVSADGSHVLFTAAGKLYVRLNGARTVQVDQPREGGAGPGGGGEFADASSDGSHVFFTDEAAAGLTGDTVSGSGENLYLYDLETGHLVDLTPDDHVAVQAVLDIGEDGSSVYFLANGALPVGGVEGQSNLYVWHDGTTRLIATLTLAESEEYVLHGSARVSPSGRYLVFQSTKSLTGYDNGEHRETFLYDGASNELVCASCNPSGEAAVYGAEPMSEVSEGAPHYVTDGGQVFFDTREALLPRDTNGQADVYEYDIGELQLISTGTGGTGSFFVDASESGEDVFFVTRQPLVPQATDEEARSIYDARVDGGLPEPSLAPPCAEVETCHAAAGQQPALYGAPASQTFSGVGNIAPPTVVARKAKSKSKQAKCGKRFVKREGRCVKRAKRSRSARRSPRRDNRKAGR
jgi:DNA-binding beta-propeller fold protein YncE